MKNSTSPNNLKTPSKVISASTPNVSDAERVISGLLGGAISAIVLKRFAKSSWAERLMTLSTGGGLLWRALSGSCPAYKAMGINRSALPGSSPYKQRQGVRVECSITVQRSVADLFNFWRNFENLPSIMRHIKKVDCVDGGKQSHWVVSALWGKTVEWSAEIIEERVNEFIAWRSMPGAEVENAGTVYFRKLDDGRGTEIRVQLKYDPPGSSFGVAVAKLFHSDALSEIKEDLTRFKDIMEAVKIPGVRGQSLSADQEIEAN